MILKICTFINKNALEVGEERVKKSYFHVRNLGNLIFLTFAPIEVCHLFNKMLVLPIHTLLHVQVEVRAGAGEEEAGGGQGRRVQGDHRDTGKGTHHHHTGGFIYLGTWKTR